MPISAFDTGCISFIRSLISLAEVARQIRDEGGDLSFAQINRVQAVDLERRSAWREFKDDMLGDVFTDSIVGFLHGRGLPNKRNLIRSGNNALNDAVDAWRDAVLVASQSLQGSDLIEVKSFNRGNENLLQILSKDFIPEASATPLRQSTELSDLITALEALGA